MRILADARWCGPHGIGRFAQEVLRRLDAFSPVPSHLPLLHPLEPLWLTTVVKMMNPDVYFTPGFNPPLLSNCKLIFGIHDLIHLRMPEEASPAKRFYYNLVVKNAVMRSSRVLTVSEFSKAEILEWTNVEDDRVTVVGNGIASSFTAVGARRNSEGAFFLFVGNRKPHKNLPHVIRAFARSGVDRDLRLFVTGTKDQQTADVVRRAGVAGRVKFLGGLTDDELAAYYRSAVALLNPSRHEGFGLPSVEAMACGCPVVAGSAGAQREVLGDAALFVDPMREDEACDAIVRVMDAETRGRLIKAGLARAQRYSWDATARKVKEALSHAS